MAELGPAQPCPNLLQSGLMKKSAAITARSPCVPMYVDQNSLVLIRCNLVLEALPELLSSHSVRCLEVAVNQRLPIWALNLRQHTSIAPNPRNDACP